MEPVSGLCTATLPQAMERQSPAPGSVCDLTRRLCSSATSPHIIACWRQVDRYLRNCDCQAGQRSEHQ